ncbi:hypothetical protein CEXT_372471 [Caerostris extrusa]|uniref:Uncharacterized protein n=1 Tax=Caerostris extrusa TaxID=172846 RepID=A0AAV4XVI7_CAEEX|nr:hypothetical protein CEXT_372471 [Caerostris extrusa]
MKFRAYPEAQEAELRSAQEMKSNVFGQNPAVPDFTLLSQEQLDPTRANLESFLEASLFKGLNDLSRGMSYCGPMPCVVLDPAHFVSCDPQSQG